MLTPRLQITLNQFLHGSSLMAKHLLNHEQTITPCLSGNASDVGKICATSCCTDITSQLYKGIPTWTQIHQSENQQNVKFLVKHSQVNEYMVGLPLLQNKSEGMALFQTFPKVRSVSFDLLNSPMRPFSRLWFGGGVCLRTRWQRWQPPNSPQRIVVIL